MKKFSRKNIAIALACVSFFGNNTSAMNNTKLKQKSKLSAKSGKNMASGNKNLKDKVPAPPKGLPKKFYPLWITLSALGLSAVAILGILGIKKLCSKDSGDQGKTPNGTSYHGLGKFGSIEELKKNWGVSCGDGQDSPTSKALAKLIAENEAFVKFLNQDNTQESELAKLKTEYANEKDYYTFSGYAEIRFDDKDSFECYDNKGKKLNLLKWEHFFIDYIAKYTKDKLGILPCMVQYDGKHSFYFKFSVDASSEDFRKDVCINYEKHTLLEKRFSSHTPIYDKGPADAVLLCELEVWGKKTK